jgi:hypothetical protein
MVSWSEAKANICCILVFILGIYSFYFATSWFSGLDMAWEICYLHIIILLHHFYYFRYNSINILLQGIRRSMFFATVTQFFLSPARSPAKFPDEVVFCCISILFLLQ